MNSKTIEMPDVSRCDAEMCAYNSKSHCRARAITIGDGAFPGCDTFLKGDNEGVSPDLVAGVGACKVASCQHNQGLECYADAIVVAKGGKQPACQTFAT